MYHRPGRRTDILDSSDEAQRRLIRKLRELTLEQKFKMMENHLKLAAILDRSSKESGLK